jgi:transposase
VRERPCIQQQRHATRHNPGCGILIQLAWLWVRHQPCSALSRWFHERVGDRRGKIRRITIVGLARKVLVALWRYVTLGLVPEGAELKA